MTITKIISGAQAGAERGGLDAAIALDVPYGGYVPKGRKAEDGRIPDRYANLTETSFSAYPSWDRPNVKASTVTVIFTYGPLSGGAKRTKQFCADLFKHYKHIDLKAPDTSPQTFATWLVILREYEVGPIVLDVEGQSESEAPGIQEAVKAFLLKVIGELREYAEGKAQGVREAVDEFREFAAREL